MYETTSTFLQSEIDYRQARLRSGLAGTRRRHHGIVSRVRRAAAGADATR